MSLLEIRNPATGTVIAAVPADDADSIAAKAAAARAAQPGWAATPVAERCAVLARYRGALLAGRDALAETLTRETGKPITQARSEVAGVAARIDFFLEHAGAAVATEALHDEAGTAEEISHDPLGLVANVSAWNYPYYVGHNVLVPALLTGNAVLYKPSEFATLSGQAMVGLLHASGVPAAALACVTGDGAVGEALLQERLDGVFFTGSHATGVRIAAALAPRMVKLQLELGGKDPTYVRADADVPGAAASLADGAMYNTGQSCCSVERIYVDARIHDAFVEHFTAAVRAMKVGDPMDPATDIGAVTRAAQLDVLQAQVDDARAQGAEVRCGGHRLPGPGSGFAPTVITRVHHGMALMREESFGPVVGIQAVAGDDEAVALMNDTRYGLTAGVYTRDAAAARALLARVRAGTVYWNCCDRVSPRLPWSGHGDSGIGLTLSKAGIEAFTRPRAWHLRRA